MCSSGGHQHCANSKRCNGAKDKPATIHLNHVGAVHVCSLTLMNFYVMICVVDDGDDVDDG